MAAWIQVQFSFWCARVPEVEADSVGVSNQRDSAKSGVYKAVARRLRSGAQKFLEAWRNTSNLIAGFASTRPFLLENTSFDQSQLTKMAISTPTIGDDFYVLPISIPPQPSFPQNAVHYVYVRRNTPKIPTANDSRSLFLTNVPVDSTELHLRGLFAALVGAGRFESATFEEERKEAENKSIDATPLHARQLLAAHGKKRKHADREAAERAEEEAAAQLPTTWTRPLRRSGSTAVVLLADQKSVEQVFKAIAKTRKSKKYPIWGEGIANRVPQLGSAWLKAHNRLTYPDKHALQASVDAFSALFARKEQEAAELAKRLRNEPDEDGFVTVTRGGGRNAPASRNEAEEARKKMVEKAEKKKQELNNFYAFQMRERKKAEQAEMVKQFEEDRKKLQVLREKRGNLVPES